MAVTNDLYPFSRKFLIVMLVYFAGFYWTNPVLAQIRNCLHYYPVSNGNSDFFNFDWAWAPYDMSRFI